MKIIKTASGNQVKMSKSEWQSIGKKAGWMKTADYEGSSKQKLNNIIEEIHSAMNGCAHTSIAHDDAVRDLRELIQSYISSHEGYKKDIYPEIWEILNREHPEGSWMEFDHIWERVSNENENEEIK